MAQTDPISFGTTVGLLTDAIVGAGMEHEQIANNIANADTPNFRRTDVPFKEALAKTLGVPPDPTVLAMKTDDPRQFAVGNGEPPQPFDPRPVVDEVTRMRVDGSNVDIDQEMARLADNAGYAQTMARLLQVQFMRYREAITEQPH
jgi:flagellar basal-body rod protein FlgB